MLSEEFEVTSKEQTIESREATETEATETEANIIRYVAGYICHYLQKKFERENHPLKEELILDLMSMVKIVLVIQVGHVKTG